MPKKVSLKESKKVQEKSQEKNMVKEEKIVVKKAKKSSVQEAQELGETSKIKKTSSETMVKIIRRIDLFDAIAKYALYILVLLLPFLFLPTPLIELGQVKFGLFVLAITVSAVSFGISSIYSGSIKLVSRKVLIPAVLISAITFLSTILSTSYRGGFIGLGNELDSWYSISLFLISVILISSIINTREKIFKMMAFFWVGFGLASLFQLVRILASAFSLDSISGLLSLGGLFDLPALNTVGTWADFGIMAGAVSLSLAITLDLVPLKASAKRVFWCLFIIGSIMSAVASSLLVGSGIDQLAHGGNFVIPSVSMVGIVSLFFALSQLYRRSQNRKNKEANEGSVVKFPLANFVLICLGALVMISPLALNQKINHGLGVPLQSVLNVRPGFSDTYIVAKDAMSSSIKNSLLGVGSHGFYIAWNQYRPIYVNNLDVWNTDLQSGVGYLPTILVNNGVLVFLLWVCSLIVLLFVSIKSLFKNGKKELTLPFAGTVLSFSALFLWINMMINASGSAVIISTFIITGLLISNLTIDKVINTRNIFLGGEFRKDQGLGKSVKNKIDVIIIVILILLMIIFACLWIQRTRAQIYSAKSMQMVYAKTASISTVPVALGLLQKSYELYPADIYARGINNLALVQVNYDVASDPLNQNMQSGQTVNLQESTKNYIKLAIDSGKNSVDANPNDFRNLLQFGSTMQTVALITEDQESAKLALQSMIQAQSLAVNNPLPFYSIANLYMLAGDKKEASSVIDATLKLKPNFTEASELQQKILISNSLSSTTTEATSTGTTTIGSKATSTPALHAPVKGSPTKKTTSKITKPSIKKPVK